MNGSYSRPLRIGTWTVDIDPNDASVEILHKKKEPLGSEREFHMQMNSKMNASGLCRSIFLLSGKNGEVLRHTALLQYHIADENCEEVEFQVASHGNRKHGSKPFYPTQKSTLLSIKQELSENSASVAFKKVYSNSGGVCRARQPSELPRSRNQAYDVKYKLKKGDNVDELLLYSKHKDENIVIEHHDVPEDLWVLGKTHMSQDLSRFCCSSAHNHPLSVDPTFNFGKFEVTPYSYKHLLLTSKRTNEPPVFIGPTAIHYSKSKNVYKKIASAVCRSAPALATEARGFITDCEKALHDALGESTLKARGLRCFNHFRRNCKEQLNAEGIRKRQEQKEGSILEAEDKSDLKARLKSAQPILDGEERRLTGVSSPRFSNYLFKQEKMMKKCMIASARKAGMRSDYLGKPARCYTNQSESVNNKLTRQKEAITRKEKGKSNMSKLEFVRDVWEEVDKQQQLELQMAICGLSEEFELTEDASYLRVEPDLWFEWNEQKRVQYVSKVKTLSMGDITKKKTITLTPQNEGDEEISEWKEFSEKYLIAAKNCKRGMYECTVHRDHITCTCPCYKYNALCKHSLCVAQATGTLKEHIDHLLRSPRRRKHSKSALAVPDKPAAGKKGSCHKSQWRPSRGKSSDGCPQLDAANRPYSDVHHNDRPLIVGFLNDELKAKECRQCRTEFSRRTTVVPFEMVLSHEERWLYPDPNKPGAKRTSTTFTKKHYCVKHSCIYRRFPYFNSTYLEVPVEVGPRLRNAHKNLLEVELDYKTLP